MSPDNPLPISIEQELVPNSQIPLTTHEFRAWKEKQGFEVGHKGTAYNPEKKAYLYTKSAWVVSDLDQAEKSLKVLGILKDHKIIHPGIEFGLSTTDDGRVQVFGVMRELEEYSAEKNGIENRQALKTGINEQNMYDNDSHVVSWIRRAVPDYDPHSLNYNPILTILSDAEARHTHNWAWDKDGTAYPIDMEVIHLNDENGGIDYGSTLVRDAIRKVDRQEYGEELPLSELKKVVENCAEKLANESDYADIVIKLTSGEVLEYAHAMGWNIEEGMTIQSYSFPGEYERADEMEKYYFLKGVMSSNNVSSNEDFLRGDKYINLGYISPLTDPDFLENPKNPFDRNIAYDVTYIRKLAKENCLALLEEWSHVLQHEGNNFLSKKYSGNTFLDPTLDQDMSEWDVAAYFVEKGINISGTAFEKRYHRKDQE